MVALPSSLNKVENDEDITDFGGSMPGVSMFVADVSHGLARLSIQPKASKTVIVIQSTVETRA